MQKAVQEVGKTHVGYFAHTLNLAAQDTMKNCQPLDDLNKKLKAIVTTTRQSTLNKEEFVRAQKSVGIETPLKLIQQVSHRSCIFYCKLSITISIC